MSAEFDFNPGLDPSSLTSITQAQLLQMVAQIVTLANKGLVVVMSGGGGTTHPDVTNNNRYINYLWIDTFTAGSPVLKLYTGTPYSDTFADWSAFAVAPNTITTLMLQALSVTIAKLSSTGGNPGQLLSVNSANGYDFVDFASFLVGNSVPLTAINKAGAADGTVLQKIAGQLQWSPLSASVFAANSIALTQLQTIGKNQLLGGDGSGIVVGVGTAGSGLSVGDVPNYFQLLSIPLTILAGTGTPAAGDMIIWDGTKWKKNTPVLIHADVAIVAASQLVASTAHNLSTTPQIDTYLVNKAANVGHGYAVGDVVRSDDFISNNNSAPPDGAVGTQKVVRGWANATNYGLNGDLGGAFYNMMKKDGSARINSSAANLALDWNARIVLRV